MRYWKEQKLVFFHVPKVAGTSVSHMLSEQFGPHQMPAGPHLTIEEAKIRQLWPTDFNAFAIIRDPYERAVSYYEWFKTNPDDAFYPEKKYVVGRTFSEWVIERYTKDTAAQTEFIDDSVTILRIENLENDLDSYLNKTLGLSVDISTLKHIYKTKHTPFLEQENIKEIEPIIYEKERWVFEKGFYERPKL